MAACLVCCPSKAPLPLWSLAPPGELPALGFINSVGLWQAQHHSPHQQEPICRPGCASRKHNYHQACLAAPGSCSSGCWARITLAAAFPEGWAARDAGSQPWGFPQHGWSPRSWTQLCWGSWAQPIRPRWITEASSHQSVARSCRAAGALCAGTRRKHKLSSSALTGPALLSQDRTQGAATGDNTTLRISLLAQGSEPCSSTQAGAQRGERSQSAIQPPVVPPAWPCPWCDSADLWLPLPGLQPHHSPGDTPAGNTMPL